MKVITDKTEPIGCGEYTGLVATLLTTCGGNNPVVVETTTTGATTFFMVAQICFLTGSQIILAM